MSNANTDLTLNIRGLADMQRLANCVTANVTLPLTIALNGTLGCGKTQLTKFICESLGIPPEDVTSPTFVLVSRHVGKVLVYHIDLYRLGFVDQIWDLGLDEFFESHCLTVIEWADKFHDYLPDNYLEVNIDVFDDGSRIAKVRGQGVRGSLLLDNIRNQWQLES